MFHKPHSFVCIQFRASWISEVHIITALISCLNIYLLTLPYPKVTLGFIPGGDFLTPKALEVINKAERKLAVIPMVFVLLRIWGTIRFFRFLYFHPEDPPAIEFLVLLQVSTCRCNYMHILYTSWFYGNVGETGLISILIILINENSCQSNFHLIWDNVIQNKISTAFKAPPFSPQTKSLSFPITNPQWFSQPVRSTIQIRVVTQYGISLDLISQGNHLQHHKTCAVFSG